MAMREMKAIIVADDLVEFLADHPRHLASVHSVFPHAVNLLIREGELITLTNQDDITPMGLTVDCVVSFAEILKAGDDVVLDLEWFKAVNGRFSVNLQDAEIWETRSILNLDLRLKGKLAQNRLALISWLAKQPSLGLLPLLPRLTNLSMSSKLIIDNIYSRYIADDLEAFTNAINTSDWNRALRFADRLIGFGMGSTPACDDFLAAYLAVFKIADALCPDRFPRVREFNNSIADRAKSRTTLISANMLRYAAEGKISRSHQRLIHACLFNNNSDLEQLANQVIRHGATSGGDFLLGVICALEWVLNTMSDIKKEGARARVDLNQLQPVPGI